MSSSRLQIDQKATLDRIFPRRTPPGEILSIFEPKPPSTSSFQLHGSHSIPVICDEFWTSKQRQGHSLHEISYRGCYKPQLPAFFIKRFCQPNDVVFDPFMGRGTTLIEAQLHGCRAIGNDINQLSILLTEPRLHPPSPRDIGGRLSEVDLHYSGEINEELLVFFHPDTLRELHAWREYFGRRHQEVIFDRTDAWIQMVACNRLTGHSRGFFSVFTLPPNQAASVKSQRKINERRSQEPEYRDTKAIILRKSNRLLRQPVPEIFHRDDALLLSQSADKMDQVPSGSVNLVVTSPPFLDNVDYIKDNWLRMWFCEIQPPAKAIWQCRNLDDWLDRMTETFAELHRILRDDGIIAFEVGEVRKGDLKLEESVIEAATRAGLRPQCVLINEQNFTKTSNCWGVANNSKGTNTNRIVVLSK